MKNVKIQIVIDSACQCLPGMQEVYAEYNIRTDNIDDAICRASIAATHKYLTEVKCCDNDADLLKALEEVSLEDVHVRVS